MDSMGDVLFFCMIKLVDSWAVFSKILRFLKCWFWLIFRRPLWSWRGTRLTRRAVRQQSQTWKGEDHSALTFPGRRGTSWINLTARVKRIGCWEPGLKLEWLSTTISILFPLILWQMCFKDVDIPKAHAWWTSESGVLDAVVMVGPTPKTVSTPGPRDSWFQLVTLPSATGNSPRHHLDPFGGFLK